MSDLDHRNYSIPLVLAGSALLGAGLVALLASAFLPIGENNAAGAIGAGLVLLFGSIGVTILLNPRSDLGATPRRSVPIAAGVILVLLLAGVTGGAALGGTIDVEGVAGSTRPSAGPPAVAATAPIGDEDFAGTLQGAHAPAPLGAVGGTGTPTQTHDIVLPAGARALCAELAWTPAGATAAQELELRIEDAEGRILASASGASPLTLELPDLTGKETRLVVSLPPGGVSSAQDYEALVRYFAEADASRG